MEKATEQKYVGNFDEVFPIIDPSELVDHKFLKHKPKTLLQRRLLDNIQKCIELELPAFRTPCIDPSEEDGEIVFKPGNSPAVGHSPIWWKETWERFNPSKNSRSGTELHYAAFMGKQIMYLIEEKKYSVRKAWKAICDDSSDLICDWNGSDKEHGFRSTRTLTYQPFHDIANTRKILEKWEDSGFWFASSNYSKGKNIKYPLASLAPIFYSNFDYDDSVGWLVMDV